MLQDFKSVSDHFTFFDHSSTPDHFTYNDLRFYNVWIRKIKLIKNFREKSSGVTFI